MKTTKKDKISNLCGDLVSRLVRRDWPEIEKAMIETESDEIKLSMPITITSLPDNSWQCRAELSFTKRFKDSVKDSLEEDHGSG